MADDIPRNRVPAPAARRASVTPISEDGWDDDVPLFDSASFDPNEFEWRPVPRRPRADGWTPEVQCTFIQTLADTGLVEHAARAVDRSVQSAYRLRRAPGGEGFARAWTVALRDAAERMLDVAFARAIEGEDTPVFDRDGCRIGSRRKVNDRMTMFLLRGYMPERFRHANEDACRPGDLPTPSLPSLDHALAALMPPPPIDPHLLLEPDRLESLVEHARDMAAVDTLCPPDDTEHYVALRVEPDHPAATDRSLRRRGFRSAETDRQEDADDR